MRTLLIAHEVKCVLYYSAGDGERTRVGFDVRGNSGKKGSFSFHMLINTALKA